MPSIRSVRPGGLVRLGLCATLAFGFIACSGDDGATQTSEGADGAGTIPGDGDGSEGVLTGPDGEETRFTAGDSASLPDGWPEGLQIPDDAELTGSTTMDGGKTMTVMAISDTAVPDLYEHFKSLLTDQGYELITDSLSDLGDETIASIHGESDDNSVAVTLMTDVNDESRTSMSLVVEAED